LTPRTFLLLTAFGLAAQAFVPPPPANAQRQCMDVGSGATYTITAENDPASLQRFPPFAFGNFPPSTFGVCAELIPWPCSGLPSTAICESGQFVAAFWARIDIDASCPCSGFLFRPVQIELHYDPARIAALGGREADLRITLYDNALGEWVELDDREVVSHRDVVKGSHTGYAQQYFAVLLGPPGSGDESTWGQIKSHWIRP
jgi:hypothetical protein